MLASAQTAIHQSYILHLGVHVAMVDACKEHQLRGHKRVMRTEEHVHEKGASFINGATRALNNSKPLKQTLPFVLCTGGGEHTHTKGRQPVRMLCLGEKHYNLVTTATSVHSMLEQLIYKTQIQWIYH